MLKSTPARKKYTTASCGGCDKYELCSLFNLAEWAVGVAPTAGPAHVLLAVLSGETVRVVEADLDAHLRART